MPNQYSNKYFLTRIKKHRLTIAKETDHKSIEKLFEAKENTLDLSLLSKGKEHEQWDYAYWLYL